jgi:hypothetical protein
MLERSGVKDNLGRAFFENSHKSGAVTNIRKYNIIAIKKTVSDDGHLHAVEAGLVAVQHYELSRRKFD